MPRAICPLCNSRKGKRECIVSDIYICSICCGETRTKEKCSGCSYYMGPGRKYSDVPCFSVERMANDDSLLSPANLIESSICEFDDIENRNIRDDIIIKILELLMDKYYFKDKDIIFKGGLEEKGFTLIDKNITDELKNLSGEEISKFIMTIYRSVRRRTNGRREFLDFIHDYIL
ncbi:MAG: hypothetical protein HY738_19390 [Bacteroidia bacterium]|nr:hypothetical protein [Bacteroidia bacterium]